MKKTIALLAAFAAVAPTFAESLTYSDLSAEQKAGLIAAWDFETSGDPVVNVGSVDYHNAFVTEDGYGLVSTAGHPWTGGISSVTGDFTMSMDLYSVVSNNWCSLLTLHSGGTVSGDTNSLQLQKGNNGMINVYLLGFGGNNGKNVLGTVAISDNMGGATLTLSYIANTAGEGETANGSLSVYLDGALVGTANELTSTSVLTGLEFGGAGGDTRGITSAKLDNVYLWNRALTATEVSGLKTPEPATATLSLLALAGLAARRRRH